MNLNPASRIAALAAVVLVAGCGESDADRAALAKVAADIRQSLHALDFGNGWPRQLRASCHKDSDRAFHCEYGYDDNIGGQCLRYTATARGTITARHEFRLDAPVGAPGGQSIEGSYDPC
jgi:hypothetical protein